MVQASGEGEQFLIRKQTMIVKNTKTIDEVYRRDAKVSKPNKIQKLSWQQISF